MMCNNKNTSRLVNKTKTQANRSRKSRSRTRKPKYLSLSKHMIKTKSQPPPPPPSPSPPSSMPRQLKNLFPLHPENLVDDRSSADEDVTLLFHGSDAADDLTALLQSATSSDSLSLSYDRQTTTTLMYDSNDDEEDRHRSLVKSAMKRNRSERDAGEEKWVCYSEVVEEVTSSSKDVGNKISTSIVRRSKKKKKNKKKKHETTSSSSGNTSTTTTNMSKSLSLALKLDYQGILNAWSDKGSLFIQGGDHHFPSSPQTVPDLKYDLGLMDVWGSNDGGNLWKVPESGGLKIKEEIEGKDNGWKVGQREASVLRYKEKRQSRLFSKRIRYEVRKLNAEKRPRMKGRFVKID